VISTDSDPSARSGAGVALLAIALAGLLAYSNSFHNDFVWDDVSSVLIHQHVHDPAMLFQLFREDQHAFGQGQGNFYRPLVSVSFMIDYQVATGLGRYEPSPFVFHLTNLLWHIAAAWFLFALLRRLGASWLVCAAVPMLYVVHPLHTEAVTYISGRADPMAGALMFAGLTLATLARVSPRGIAAAVLGLVCFVAALLSKESAMIFPVLLFLVILAQPGVRLPARRLPWAMLLASLIILGVYVWLRATVLDFGSDSGAPQTTFWGRLLEVLQAFGTYIRLIFWPTDLHMERTLTGYTWLNTVWGGLVLVASLGLLAVALLRGWRLAAFGMAWFFVSWLPISGIFPLNAPLAEHWLYVPLAGFITALLDVIARALYRPAYQGGMLGALAVLSLVLLAMTLERNRDWRDNVTLFRATLAQNPQSTRVHFNLAVTYEDLTGNLIGARRHYETILDIYAQRKTAAEQEMFWEEELNAHLSLGKIYLQQQRYDLAAQHFVTLLRLQPTEQHRALMGSAAFGLGQYFLAVGDQQRAVDAMEQAIELWPELAGEVARVLRQTV
jgi:protein O-mannosyl-transferase